MSVERVCRFGRSFTFGEVYRVFRELMVPAGFSQAGLTALQYEKGLFLCHERARVHGKIQQLYSAKRLGRIERECPSRESAIDNDHFFGKDLLDAMLGREPESVRFSDILDEIVEEAAAYSVARRIEWPGAVLVDPVTGYRGTGYRALELDAVDGVSLLTFRAPCQKRLDWMEKVFLSCFPSASRC